MKTLLATIAVILVIQNSDCKVFTRCALAKALLSNGFPRNDLENWVCLVESESNRNTAAIGRLNTNGSRDYGLFQINSRYWCGIGHRAGGCNIDCNQLLNDNIYDDSKCAKHIFTIHSWQGWYGWIKKCKNQSLPNIRAECGI
ncbi:uncharacterized protein CBL_14451 [Carabus blaptoides fortunei]